MSPSWSSPREWDIAGEGRVGYMAAQVVSTVIALLRVRITTLTSGVLTGTSCQVVQQKRAVIIRALGNKATDHQLGRHPRPPVRAAGPRSHNASFEALDGPSKSDRSASPPAHR